MDLGGKRQLETVVAIPIIKDSVVQGRGQGFLRRDWGHRRASGSKTRSCRGNVERVVQQGLGGKVGAKL